MGRRTWHRAALGLALTAVFAPLLGTETASAGPRADCVLRVELSGVVTPGMARFLESGVAAAAERSCALLVVIDTPGGMVDATRDIVRAFLGSAAPVITYVGDEGARAASAGALIAMAGHVAAMAPSTHIGAAHPVALGGEESSSAMDEKLVSDVAAFARAVAERRGRNASVAERMVRESTALTASEAVAQRVVDLEAPDERALLDVIGGRSVETSRGRVALDFDGAEVEAFEMALPDRILHRLGDPSLAYALMMIGVMALLFELTTPGVGAAGAVGALALFLAFLGLSKLPVDVGGVALLFVGVGLLVAELFIVSHGLLALAGLGALVLGALLLVDLEDPDFWLSPDFAVGWGLLIPMALAVGASVLVLVGRLRRSARAPSTTGRDALVGQLGRATRDVDADGGEVGVLGERWTAYADEPIHEGTRVRVVDVEGLWLKVQAESAPRAHE